MYDYRDMPFHQWVSMICKIAEIQNIYAYANVASLRMWHETGYSPYAVVKDFLKLEVKNE